MKTSERIRLHQEEIERRKRYAEFKVKASKANRKRWNARKWQTGMALRE